MKTRTIIILIIGLVLIASSIQAKKEFVEPVDQYTIPLVDPNFSFGYETEIAEGVGAGALAKKSEDEPEGNNGVWVLVGVAVFILFSVFG